MTNFYADFERPPHLTSKANFYADFERPPGKTSEAPAGASIGDYARSIAQGVSFGWGDELEARVKSIFDGSESYELKLARIRDEMQAFSDANPKSDMALQLAGGFAVPGAAALKAGKAALTGGRALAAAVGVGAAEGAAAGAGYSEKEITDPEILRDAAVGAGVGGAFGGVAPTVVRKLHDTADTVLTNVGSAMGSKAANNRLANQSAARAVQHDADFAGTTFADELQRIRDKGASGDDIGASLLSSGGENVQALAAKNANVSGRTQATINKLSDDAATDLRTFSRSEYEDKLYKLPAIDPVKAEALAKVIAASPSLAIANRKATRALADLGENADPKTFTPQRIDQIDRALQDAVGGSKGNAKHAAEAVRTKFRAVIDEHFPDLTKIQKRYAEGAEIQRALPKPDGPVRGIKRDPMDAVWVGAHMARGHKAQAVARLMKLVGLGGEARAEAIVNLLATKAKTPLEFGDALIAIEAMNPARRSAYLDAAAQAGSKLAISEYEQSKY